MITPEQELFVNCVMAAIKWRLDVDSGEMIEARKNGMQYCKDHLSHPGSMSQKDLNSICAIVNGMFSSCGSNLMIANSMGEFIPAWRK